MTYEKIVYHYKNQTSGEQAVIIALKVTDSVTIVIR